MVSQKKSRPLYGNGLFLCTLFYLSTMASRYELPAFSLTPVLTGFLLAPPILYLRHLIFRL